MDIKLNSLKENKNSETLKRLIIKNWSQIFLKEELNLSCKSIEIAGRIKTSFLVNYPQNNTSKII